MNHLDPSIKKSQFSAREDLKLLQLQSELGNKWSEIIKNLQGRTENQVKNRFNTLAKQKREERRKKSQKYLDDVIEKVGEDLVIDVNGNGEIDPASDITIEFYFAPSQAIVAGSGYIEQVGNLGGQEILDFFNENTSTLTAPSFDSATGADIFQLNIYGV